VAAAKGVAAPVAAQAGEAGAGRRCVAAVGRAQGRAAGQRRRAAPAGHEQLLALANWIGRTVRVPAWATWAKPPTPWARSWSVRCRGQGGLNAAQMLSQPMKALLLLDVEPAARRRRCRRRQAALAGFGPGGRADRLQGRRRRQRRRAAADRPVHRDVRHLRQCRRPRAELPRRRQAAGRCAPGLEGAARAGQPAGPGRLCAGPAKRCAPRRWATWPRWPAPGQRRPRRAVAAGGPAAGLERVADVPIYSRRQPGAPRRVAAADRRCTRAGGRPAERAVATLGLQPGDKVLVSQGRALPCCRARRPTLAATAVRVPPATRHAALGAMFGPLTVEKA
jgi:NADH-quinone oxidoreductase subunit G